LSLPADPEPQLLEPQRLAAPRLRGAAILVVGIVGAALVVGTGLWTLIGTNSDKGAAALTEIVSHASASSFLVPIDTSRPELLDGAIAALRLNYAERQHIRDEVLAGRLRLGATMAWDWDAEDGDVVSLTSAGFVQTVSLLNAPQLVVIPYAGDATPLLVTGVHDGDDMGITAAVGTPANPFKLRALRTGEVTQVGMP
jgi:hypothetical protein